MICENLSLNMVAVFWSVAGLAVVLALYVMQQTEHDEINKKDPRWIQWLRRAGFCAMAVLLGYAMLDYASQLSLLLVFGSGVYSLAVNAAALWMRSSSPDSWEGAQDGGYSSHLGYLIAREFDRINRSNLYTHRLVEAILLNMELKPDSASTSTMVYPTQYHPNQS
jgi:hypothetical protein